MGALQDRRRDRCSVATLAIHWLPPPFPMDLEPGKKELGPHMTNRTEDKTSAMFHNTSRPLEFLTRVQTHTQKAKSELEWKILK